MLREQLLAFSSPPLLQAQSLPGSVSCGDINDGEGDLRLLIVAEGHKLWSYNGGILWCHEPDAHGLLAAE